MAWLILAILASLLWAIVQLVDKTLIASAAPSTQHYWAMTGVAAIAPVAIILVAFPKFAMLPEIAYLALAMLAGCCYFVSNAFFFRAVLSIGDRHPRRSLNGSRR